MAFASGMVGEKSSRGEEPAEVPEPAPVDSGEPIGVQLAPDVRLPAAALPLDMKISPVAEKVLREIQNDYYREVRDGTLRVRGTLQDEAEDPLVTDAQGNQTLTIRRGSIEETARKRADERFKAIFGHAAYNRMTMNSLLESRMGDSPSAPAGGAASASE